MAEKTQYKVKYPAMDISSTEEMITDASDFDL